MPQIEILRMVGLLAFVSTPDRHLGGILCTWIVLQAWQSVPMNSWSKKKSNSSTSPKFESQPRCFHLILHMDRDIQGRKVDIQKLHEISVPTHPRSMNLKTRTRRYGKNFGRCAFWNSEQIEVHEFFFPTSPYSPKIDSEQESYVHFIPPAVKCSYTKRI